LDDGEVSNKEQIKNNIGRLSSALIILGFYSIGRALQYLIPASQASRVGATSKTEDHAANLVAKRACFIWVGLSIETILMCMWEFKYSDDFRNNIYRFKVAFQLCQMMLDLVTWLGIPIFGSDFWDPHRKRNFNFVFDSKDSGWIFFFKFCC
jgi:hypothetical protein